MDDLRPSPLDDRHRALGATMTGFAAWTMPLDYGSVVAEHRAVRESCGVFDLSHLGSVVVGGADARAVVQRAFTNDADDLGAGACQYTLCLDEEGGVVDDLIVSWFADFAWVVPNAANTAAVLDALADARASLGADADAWVRDVGADTACVAVQGPDSPRVVTAAGIDVDDLDFMHGRRIAVATDAEGALPGSGGGLVTRTGYTGELGYEIVCPRAQAGALWDRLLAAGATPAGLGARDTLRLEMGYPLHGNDLSRSTSPVAARLGWAVKPGTGFRGEAAYLRAQEAGAARRLWGLRALERGVPRAGQEVRRDGREVGRTTSGTFSPTLKLGIALGYVDARPGDRVVVDVRGRDLHAEVVAPPFVDADPHG